MKGIENFRVFDLALCDTSIAVGDWVRSYDFEWRDDCCVLGRVEKIGEVWEGCERYTIRVFQSVTDGQGGQRSVDHGASIVHPPVNGTPHSFGGFCNGVRKVDEETREFWQERYDDWASDVDVG